MTDSLPTADALPGSPEKREHFVQQDLGSFLGDIVAAGQHATVHAAGEAPPRVERAKALIDRVLNAATTMVVLVSIKAEGLSCEARLSRQPGNNEEVGVEHVEPGKDQHQAAGGLQHSLRKLQPCAGFEPAHRRRTKDDRDGPASTEGQ
jgi:hypothetical protein